MSSFEDLQVWRRSKDLASKVILAIAPSKNYGLKDQMIRSAISVPSNIAEGAERKGTKEFANFISYSSGSCAELMTQIMIASDIGELDRAKADNFLAECREISKMLYGLRRSLHDSSSL
ncbi:MAG: four helix bundle protein [Verrucomicrobiae bacterium]|nr:four helix bundle protein [Verrucomicrobiae bacterium]NNJ42504.1 four helix bundle protein [Akkermansiaceae bacterium]